MAAGVLYEQVCRAHGLKGGTLRLDDINPGSTAWQTSAPSARSPWIP